MVNHRNSFGLSTFSSALALLDFRNWSRRRNLRPKALISFTVIGLQDYDTLLFKGVGAAPVIPPALSEVEGNPRVFGGVRDLLAAFQSVRGVALASARIAPANSSVSAK